MDLVILESPFFNLNEVERMKNVLYARACVRDSLLKSESPIASHLLHTQEGILDDHTPAERAMGIKAGLAWLRVADKTVVYRDRGISKGMKQGIIKARDFKIPVQYRTLSGEQMELLELAYSQIPK